MKFTLVRHATSIIEFAGKRFLIDPILYRKNTLDPVDGGINEKNPLVDIVVTDDVIKDIDIILLTHLHKDHFDPDIFDFFGKGIPIVCSEEYDEQLSKIGFSNLNLIKDSIEIDGVKINLTKGQHGSGVVGKMMGNSYGFILNAKDEKTIYITGDTVWCKCVEETIATYKPSYIIAFGGSAIMKGVHITMNMDDINNLLNKANDASVIAIHMDAWNHCLLTRLALKKEIQNKNLYIPNDGETLAFI